MMTTQDKLKSLVLMMNEAKTGKVEIYPADLNLFEELIEDLEDKLKSEADANKEDLYFFFFTADEVKSLHSLMMTRPLGHMDSVRKQIEEAYDAISHFEKVGEV